MEELNQKENAVKDKTARLGLLGRFLYALYSAPPIGILIGFLLSKNTSSFEGEYGLTVLYNSVIMIVIVFLVLLFIKRSLIHKILAVISAIIWIVALFNL